MYPQSIVDNMNDFQLSIHKDMLELSDTLLHNDWSEINIRELVLKPRKTLVLDYFKHEGYWASSHSISEQYPTPIPNRFKQEDMEVFLPKLQWVESQIIYRAPKNHVSKLPQAFKMHFMGYSTCRCCGEKNGTGEYYFQGWSWPDGYMHYLVEHKVEPSAAFMVFINSTYAKYNK